MFYASIINKFNDKIAKLENSAQEQLKKADIGIGIAAWALDIFKESVSKTGFESIEEEIAFFKAIKCQPMKYLILYTEIRSCEARMPKLDLKLQLSFLDKQTKKVNQFFTKHTEFIIYMNQGYTHLDEYYFTRKNQNKNAIVKSYPYYKDSIFNTSHDELWARIKGFNMYANYIKKKKEFLKNCEGGKSSKLIWTGSYAAFVELIYGLQEMGTINNGNEKIKKVIEVLGDYLQVPRGNHSRTYSELKARKGTQVKFLEEATKKLRQKMADEDDVK
ncbi:RteC domain-containing protein [Muricauda oceani]|uniref:RteC protein n=1 Tax=Flagellimonas oceani TaxID=2698672 RepID=A0A6G7IZ71_9FLAO|nr:RteC domain-containing protein [Allomuricauda oceani]MBW8244844.1 RteC domain-containing protein [Allomuricauda oceani]QII43846.1 hypothetical protein GVT53_03860 [Allomuricauda oceani]